VELNGIEPSTSWLPGRGGDLMNRVESERTVTIRRS
jgi:hypothetical protein